MNQAEVGRLIAGLRYRVPSHPAKFTPRVALERRRGRLYELREMVSALVSTERVELSKAKAHLTRAYAERLIGEAVHRGDRHAHTMDVAKWWLKDDPQALHKLFKVIAPRFREDHDLSSYTRIFHAPYELQDNPKSSPHRILVEIKGHPFPPLHYSNTRPNRNHIHNVLLAEAKKDARMNKAAQQPKIEELDTS